MAYQKYVYSRINWENKSDSLATPLGKTNLNKMDSAIYNIAENLDVVQNDLGSGKLDKSDAGKMIVGMPAWNPNTGVLSFRFYDGTIFQVDFNVEKIPVSFSMDSAGVITMATSDGTQWTADIGDVVPDYAFDDSDTIAFQMGYEWDASAYSGVSDYGYGPPENWGIGENMGKSYVDKATGIMYTCVFSHGAFSVVERQLSRAGGNRSLCANIRKNSITGEHLRLDYLADITVKAGDAAASAKEASDFADDAAFDAQLAQSYAVGGSGVRQGEDADNAKKYKELCQDIFDNFQQAGSVTGVKGAKESGFRHGNVSISPEDIGAVAKGDVANNLVTTNGGWVLDARQGKVLQDEITGINDNLSQICSDSMNISIPYHDATITFLRTGQFCMAYIEHHVKGENWDCGSMGIWVPRKFRPAEYAEPGNTARRIQFHANGNIGFHGKAGEDFWDYGFVAYKCAD